MFQEASPDGTLMGLGEFDLIVHFAHPDDGRTVTPPYRNVSSPRMEWKRKGRKWKFTPLDFNKYAALARQAAAEGCVLLKNENEALPLRKGDKVAVFGRIAFHYYKSGLGSGGLVNTKYVVGILDALKEEKDITLDENLLGTYEKWIEKNPYDEGQGWGKVPWSQKEMELTDEIVESAKGADAAIVVVGRTAGEDQDNKNEAGSYLLTDTEKEMVEKVSKAFARTIVVLNVGNIIDMKWVKECNPAAVLYVWQGGQEGGNGVADVLMGRVNPCGKLTDTIAENIEDYPSQSCFGDLTRNEYKEDIYVDTATLRPLQKRKYCIRSVLVFPIRHLP